MKRKVVYTCNCCGCRIQRHKVIWEDGKPYCKACHRSIEKDGKPFFSNSEIYMDIYRQEQRKAFK